GGAARRRAGDQNHPNRRAGDRLPRERQRVRVPGDPPARLSRRCACLRRRGAAARARRLSRACRLPARLWTDTLPGSGRAAHRGAGGDRAGRDRLRAAVLVGGYSIQNTVTPGRPSSPDAARRLWYQWYFNTEVGRAGLAQNRRALSELLWREWSPTWRFTPEMFNLTATSFDNPDFVDCVIHSYRHRNFNAPGEPRFLEMERKLAGRPPIVVPTISLHGGDDGFGRAAAEISAAEREVLPKIVAKRIVDGAGHFVPHEKPEAVASALLELLGTTK